MAEKFNQTNQWWDFLDWFPDPGELNQDENLQTIKGSDTIFLGQYGAPDKNFRNASLRYPHKDIQDNSDYVLFEFKKYLPPFKDQRRKTDLGDGTVRSDYQGYAKQGTYDYNRAGEYEDAEADGYKSIVMYMPEDISTGFQGQWGAKAFSTSGADQLRAVAQNNLGDKLNSALQGAGASLSRSVQLGGAQVIRQSLKAITGDDISNDDVFGAISGAILNPNTELLFSAVDVRNFQLSFNLVPRNAGEAKQCNEIVKIFKMCTLPSRNPGDVFGADADKNSGIGAGFIGVPNLCRVSFMHGAEEHPVLPKFKMCAVTKSDVIYTPDGAYATYPDGQPVAMQLKINFQETKIVFADEVQNDNIR